MTKIVIIGSGGHALSCLDVILATKSFEIVGYVDRQKSQDKHFATIPYLGDDDQALDVVINVGTVFLGIGQIENAELRKKLVKQYSELGVEFPSIVSPLAYVSPLSTISAGTIVMHKAYVGPGVQVGSHCILNTNSHLEHGVTVGDYSHISTASVVNGDVVIGRECFIGSNSTLCHGIRVPDHSFVQASRFIGRKHEWA